MGPLEADHEVVHALLAAPLRLAYLEHRLRATRARRFTTMPRSVVAATIATSAEIAARYRGGGGGAGAAPARPG